MKITICTSGRFHVADLARELIALGHEVVFHSIVPAGRLARFGIPRANQRCHLPAVLPLVAAKKKLRLPCKWSENLDLWMQRILDARFAKIEDPGDVFIGMSGLCVKSLAAAKQRGAKILLERGSRHILSQKQILDALAPGHPSPVPDWAVERELAGYAAADVIVVPAHHAEQSFVEKGMPPRRVFRNPYGVDLSGFPPTDLVEMPFDVIIVGLWSRQKGCDLLSKVVLDCMKLKLLHVGPIGDAPLSSGDLFRHVDAVPQYELPRYYSQARIFAMPSRQEGLALVQAQALACGLPIVGSTRSGAEDLAELTGLDATIIQAVPPDDGDALALAIQRALSVASHIGPGPRDLLGNQRERLSWRAYGERYHRFLQQLH